MKFTPWIVGGFVFAIALWGVGASAADAFPDQASDTVRVQRLRCEYRKQPLGIDHSAPRLSWTLESSVRGQKQTAYRVLVARNLEALQAGRGDLWDSGKVESNQTVNVLYAGGDLVSGQRC